MNRIERIKARMDTFEYSNIAIVSADIEYLLSKLEIAEKALEQIHELDDGDPNVSLGKIAAQALQQIRE